MEYSVVCVWDQPTVTEVMRMPVALPTRAPGESSANVLCKLLVVPDGVKLVTQGAGFLNEGDVVRVAP